MTWPDPYQTKAFWVYTTERFHSLETREDMGDEFLEMYRPVASCFPVARALNQMMREVLQKL